MKSQHKNLCYDSTSLEQSLKNVDRLNYKEILKTLKLHSSRFNNLHSEVDLKKMNSRQAIDLINWFNEYAFDIPREKLFLSFESNVNLPESAA